MVRIELTVFGYRGPGLHPRSRSAACLASKTPGRPVPLTPNLRMTRVGFEPNLASLKDWQPHQKSNGPCLCAHDLRDRWNDCSMWAGRRSNPSLLVFSQALNHLSYQPGTVFRTSPTAKEEARCPLCDTGLLRACGGLGPMSRQQGIRGFFAWQTCIPRTTGKMLPNLGAHGFCCELLCR